MKIVFYHPFGFDFNGNSIYDNNGLGGSETSILYISKYLAKLGNDVSVYCVCSKPGVYNNVIYKNFKDYNFSEPVDLFIGVRCSFIFSNKINSKFNYLWVHDLCAETKNDSNILRNLDNISKIVTVSEFQKKNYQKYLNLEDKKFFVSRNGINLDFFRGEEKKENRLIWTSSPIKTGNKILDIFPRILEKYPTMELHMYHYVWRGHNPGDFYERAEKIKNIKIMGSANQQKLAREIMKSKLLIHPNTYPETSCISAIEAQAAGTPFITTKLGALDETIIDEKTGYLIKSDPSSNKYIEDFLKIVFKLLENKSEYNRIVKNGKKRVKEYYPWKLIAKEFNDHINLEFEKKNFKNKNLNKLKLIFSNINSILKNNDFFVKKKSNAFIYDRSYYEEKNNLSFYTGYHDFPLFSKIAEQLMRFKPKKSLDCGCAKGFLVKHLYEKGVDAHGFDISDYALDHSDELIKSRLKKIDIRDKLNYKSKFDLITCMDILNHVEENEIKNVFLSLDNLLKKKGIIFLSMTFFSDLKTINYFKNHDQGIKIFRDKNWWINFFNKNGFRFVDLENPEGEFDSLLNGILYREKDYKISIIMPNYNNEKYLDESINSVLNQTYNNWELIIVDDASTDNSMDIINNYGYDKRIKVFQNKKNKGVSATRNECVKNCTSDIILQLDPDDYLEKDALKIVNQEFVLDPNLFLVYSDLNKVIEGKIYPTPQPDINSFEEWRKKPHAFHVSAYKKKVILDFGGFNENLKTCEDINFYYRIFENKLKFKHIKNFLYNWRINPEGLTKTNKMVCVECEYGKTCLFYKYYKEKGLIK